MRTYVVSWLNRSSEANSLEHWLRPSNMTNDYLGHLMLLSNDSLIHMGRKRKFQLWSTDAAICSNSSRVSTINTSILNLFVKHVLPPTIEAIHYISVHNGKYKIKRISNP